MDRHSGELVHRKFYELPELLREGDCIVLNNSRVLPARLIGRMETGGIVEVLLLSDISNANRPSSPSLRAHEAIQSLSSSSSPPKTTSSTKGQWECLTKPGKKMKPGVKLVFGNGELTATVKGITDDGNRLIEFTYDGMFLDVLKKLGKMPLPPYIQEELQETERYQTVYSSQIGSAAAPTAGLHFTHELLSQIALKGIKICYLTLHVGLGTFRPVKTDKIEDHKMHAESFILPKETAEIINNTKKSGGRIIAVGTTSCRVLESNADENGTVSEYAGLTDIFIYPGYTFKCIDGLITNFHLPESTLIMLVSAFTSREKTLRAYEQAIQNRYRFYSFGDAMLIL